jgi:hypothetical protein
LLYFISEVPTKTWTSAAKVVLMVSVFLLVGRGIYNQSPLKQNIERINNPKAYATSENSFNNYFSENLFSQVKQYIGKPEQSYKVASIGLHPSVALYNGFYTIDGYSNNYPLSYKQNFRQLIAKELEKNADISDYFNNWGNRCYLFCAELGRNFYAIKYSGIEIENLQLNASKLKEFGCEYIFSAVPIQNAEENSLLLLQTFENSESPYRIHLYEVIVKPL